MSAVSFGIPLVLPDDIDQINSSPRQAHEISEPGVVFRNITDIQLTTSAGPLDGNNGPLPTLFWPFAIMGTFHILTALGYLALGK